jgi:hypothetical protein
MKPTISPLLISIVGACMLALSACSGTTTPSPTDPIETAVCPAPDSVPTQGQSSACRQ